MKQQNDITFNICTAMRFAFVLTLFMAMVLLGSVSYAKSAEATPAITPAATPSARQNSKITPTPTVAPAEQQQGDPSPTPVATPTEAQPGSPTPTPAPILNNRFLILVNWNNPYYGDHKDLVRLSTVIDKGLVKKSNYHYIDQTAGEAANRMFNAAKEDGVTKFLVDNVYRSVESQQIMWKKKLRSNPSYGADPLNFPVKVLPGGKSEHATGLALDILATTHTRSNEAFANTPQGIWLAQNAHRFGFILRYPKNKQHITGVLFEPWHYRYVGEAHAQLMYEKNLCLEEYVVLLKSGQPARLAY